MPNLLRALNERVFNVENEDGTLSPTPQAAPRQWERLGWISRRLALEVRERVPHVQRLTVDQFVEQCPAQKRQLYAQAGEEYTKRGLGSRDCVLKAFVKFEKIKFEPEGKKSDPCPRLIQPRSPVFNVALGRFTRRIEEELYHALGSVWEVDEGEKVVMKGLTNEQMADQLYRKWVSFKNPVAVGLDASRFDQHIGEQALRYEHSVYERVYCGTDGFDELLWLLKAQRNNRGVAFLDGHRVDYEIKGTRASGDMNTGLGNCIIMSSLILQYCKERRIEAKLANNGDDCLVFMDAANLPRFSAGFDAWFLSYGINMKVEEPSRYFEHCEFCQMRPVWSGWEWVMVRSPRNAISKDTLCLGEKTEDYLAWIHAVGVCGQHLYGDMPLYNCLYTRMIQAGRPTNIAKSNTCRNTGMFIQYGFNKGKRHNNVVQEETRLSFAIAFGISPQRQLDIEAELALLSFDGIEDASLGTELALFN